MVRGIGVTSQEDSGFRMFFEEFINCSFNKRKFMDKFVLKPCSGEIHSYMDGDRVVRMVKDDWKESAGRNINGSDKLVKIPLPEDEDTTMSMPCREGKFWVQSVF